MNVYQRPERGLIYYGRYTDPKTHQRRLVNLGTTVKKDAEVRLRKIFTAAQEGRFDAIEATKLRPDVATVGEALEAFELFAAPRMAAVTIKGYRNSLRYVIRTVLGDEPAPDTRSTSVLTGDLVVKFQNKLVTAAGADRNQQDRAKASANSFIRQARAVFGKDARASYSNVTLPASLDEFMHAALLDEPSTSYRMPAADLVEKTTAALAATRDTDRNVYVAFLLAYGAGMRRNEIAHARYSWINENNGRTFLAIGTTDDFRPKGRDARTVPLEKFLVDELKALRLPTVGEVPDYILTGGNNERTEETFERLATIMRGVGWTTDKAAHELRKLYGSKVATSHGLFAAQKILGHKKPDVTSRYYAGLVSLPEVKIFEPAAQVA